MYIYTFPLFLEEEEIRAITLVFFLLHVLPKQA